MRRKAYQAWNSMKDRCLNANNPKYIYYGARGINLCDRWLKFDNFLEDMGYPKKGLSLDRINNDGNYEPGNCRWATWKQQRSNQRPRNTIVKPNPQIHFKRIVIIRHLYHSQGWSFNRISEKFGFGWHTVKKYALEADLCQ